MRETNQKNKLYNVRVYNYSLPSFISGYISYYGTEQEIMKLLESNKNRTDIIAAAKQYFSGKGPGEGSLFGEKPMPIINPVEFIGEAVYQRSNFNYRFFNNWRCETDINIEFMRATLIYIVDQDRRIKRCMKAVIKNATYISEFTGKRSQVADTIMGYWGYPGFIKASKEYTNQFILQNTAYYVDTIFKNKHTAHRDIQYPHKPYLREFFFGIYGDG